MLSADVVVHALDNSWELHKPYLQKSWLLSSMLKKAQMTGMRNIEEEDEEDSTSGGGEIGMNRGYHILYNNKINACILIGQSAMVYCAGKPMEKSRVF